MKHARLALSASQEKNDLADSDLSVSAGSGIFRRYPGKA